MNHIADEIPSGEKEFSELTKKVRDLIEYPELSEEEFQELLTKASRGYGGSLPHRTRSLCPETRRIVPAVIWEKDGKVWISKKCPEGLITEVYYEDVEMYHRFKEWGFEERKLMSFNVENSGINCPFDCGLCKKHHSHTNLLNIVLTNRCDLSCWYCFPEDEEALFKIGDRVGLFRFEEIAKNLAFEYRVEINGFSGRYSVPENLYVLTFEDGKARWTRVTKFLRREHTGKILRIRTHTGRRVRTTPEHKLFVYENGNLVKKRADEIEPGVRLVLIWNFDVGGDMGEIDLLEAFRSLPEEEKKKIYVKSPENTIPLNSFPGISGEFRLGMDDDPCEIPSKLILTPGFGKLVGYFILNGHYTDEDISITVSHDDLEDILSVLNNLGIPHSVIKLDDKVERVVIRSRLVKLIFKHALGIPGGTENRRLPKDFLRFPREVRLALLNSIKKHLGNATVSRGLIRDVLYLLASLGIPSNDVERLDLRSMEEHSETAGVEKVGDFYIDAVEEVTEEECNGYVYDLEVENEGHSCVVSDGILVSNCFFYAREGQPIYEPTLEQIRMMLRNAKKEIPIGATAVQFTGGEPTLREDLVEIIKIAKEEGYDHIQLNTDGIRLAFEPELVKKIREAGVNTLYLSYDGMTPQTNWKNHWEIPLIFENVRKAGGPGIVFVPTTIRNVNDHELGAIINFGLNHLDIVRGVNFQPISLVGRVPKRERQRFRITIPGAIKKIEEQTNGAIAKDDWYPVPIAGHIGKFFEAFTGSKYYMTSHFGCGAATYVFLDENRVIPISRFLDVEGFVEFLEEKAEELEKWKRLGRLGKLKVGAEIFLKFKSFYDEKYAPKSFDVLDIIKNAFAHGTYEALGEFHYKTLFLGMMHFMDEYNYDVERVERCVVHYAMPDGRIVPFCAFNVIPELYRDKVQAQFSYSWEEWKAVHPDWEYRKDKYVRIKRFVEKMKNSELYRKTYIDIKQYF